MAVRTCSALLVGLAACGGGSAAVDAGVDGGQLAEVVWLYDSEGRLPAKIIGALDGRVLIGVGHWSSGSDAVWLLGEGGAPAERLSEGLPHDFTRVAGSLVWLADGRILRWDGQSLDTCWVFGDGTVGIVEPAGQGRLAYAREYGKDLTSFGWLGFVDASCQLESEAIYETNLRGHSPLPADAVLFGVETSFSAPVEWRVYSSADSYSLLAITEERNVTGDGAVLCWSSFGTPARCGDLAMTGSQLFPVRSAILKVEGGWIYHTGIDASELWRRRFADGEEQLLVALQPPAYISAARPDGQHVVFLVDGKVGQVRLPGP